MSQNCPFIPLNCLVNVNGFSSPGICWGGHPTFLRCRELCRDECLVLPVSARTMSRLLEFPSTGLASQITCCVSITVSPPSSQKGNQNGVSKFWGVSNLSV